MDSLVRRRELLTVVLLIAMVARLVVGLVVGFGFGFGFGDLLLVVAAVAAAIWCTRPVPTRNAHVLLVLAVVGAGLCVVAALVLQVARLLEPDNPYGIAVFFTGLPDLVLPTLAVVAGAVVLNRLPGAVAASPPSVPDGQAQPQLPQPLPEAQRPTWQPGQASGVAWHTAGDAAAGAPASGWGQDDQSAGWQPIPRQAPPQER